MTSHTDAHSDDPELLATFRAEVEERLAAMTPATYIGIAPQLVDLLEQNPPTKGFTDDDLRNFSDFVAKLRRDPPAAVADGSAA